MGANHLKNQEFLNCVSSLFEASRLVQDGAFNKLRPRLLVRGSCSRQLFARRFFAFGQPGTEPKRSEPGLVTRSSWDHHHHPPHRSGLLAWKSSHDSCYPLTKWWIMTHRVGPVKTFLGAGGGISRRVARRPGMASRRASTARSTEMCWAPWRRRASLMHRCSEEARTDGGEGGRRAARGAGGREQDGRRMLGWGCLRGWKDMGLRLRMKMLRCFVVDSVPEKEELARQGVVFIQPDLGFSRNEETLQPK